MKVRIEIARDQAELWARVADGYSEAALDLLEKLLEDEVHADGTVHGNRIWPALGNLRHSIELRLKAIGHRWTSSGRDAETEINWTPNSSHRLVATWDSLIPLLEHRFDNDISQDPQAMAQARADLELVELIDPRGMEFRYPEDLRSNAHQALLDGIDLHELVAAAERLDELLSAMAGAVDMRPDGS